MTRSISGDGLYSAMPLFHNSGRSAFNYAMARNARFVLRDRFSASDFWSDVRATGCVTAALVGPMTALLYSAPPKDDDADSPLRNVDPRPDDPRDRRLRAPLRRARRHRVRADRDRHGRHHRLGPRSLGELRAHPRGLPVAGGAHRRRVRRAGARRRGGGDARAQRRAVGAQRRLLQDARADRGGVAQRLVPHRRRLPSRRGRLVLLRRPSPRHDPSPGREHLVVRGRDDRGRAPGGARVRRDRRARAARRGRRVRRRDRRRPRPPSTRRSSSSSSSRACRGSCCPATSRWSTISRAPRHRCGSASTSCATRASPRPRGTGLPPLDGAG